MFVSKNLVTKDGIDYLVEILSFDFIPEYSVDIYKIVEKPRIIFFKKSVRKKVYSITYLKEELENIINKDDFLITLVNKAFASYTKNSDIKIKKEVKRETQNKLFDEWDGVVKSE